MTDESIFAAALAIPVPSQRAAYLDQACAGQPDLRREVEELLVAHADDHLIDRPPPFSERGVGRTGAYESDMSSGPPAAVAGDRIGPYRLMEQIGEGGFGLVFVAEQSEPVRRKVALKVIKPGMDTRDVVARFEAERQALALMDHPNIARVFEAGSTPAGRPYFVMELVRGVPITEYCDQNKLSPSDRLALFVQVCHAIQHAHQKGIIHRDIKPGNVLVASHDGVPVPKVIDFGVAKAVGPSLTEKTIYTRFAQLIGTPLYMSPEQAEMSGLDVDTRTDVYALGVLLYELLTGATPFDRDRFRKAAFDEIRRIIREEEPPRPSTRLSSLRETLPAVSANRKTEPDKLAGLLRGELDWIVMRCLEKDRNRRYETANGLARDVQRYLGGDAVEACPPTLGYRLRKMFRRNKAAVSITLGFAAVLLLGIVLTTWQAVRATNAEAASFEHYKNGLEQLVRLDQQRVLALCLKDEAVAAHKLAETERDKVARANESLRRLTAEQRRTLYAISMNLAQDAWEAGDPPRTFELLKQQVPGPGEDELRGFEWHYWDRFAHLDLQTVQLSGFVRTQNQTSASSRFSGSLTPKLSADGTRVAAYLLDPTGQAMSLKLWETETGKELWSAPVAADLSAIPSLQFTSNGRHLVTSRFLRGSGGKLLISGHSEVRVWDTATGKPVYSTLSKEGEMFLRPTFSPDGTRLALIAATMEGTNYRRILSVRRLPDGKEIFRFPPDKSTLASFAPAFSQDGKRIVAFTFEGLTLFGLKLRVWDLEGGGEIQTTDLSDTFVPRDVRYSRDGTQIGLRVGDDMADRVLLLDGNGNRRQVFTLPSLSSRFAQQPPVAFDPGGTRLAVPQGAQVYLYNIDPKRPADADPLLRAIRGHGSTVRDAAFSSDGSRLFTVDAFGVVKQWDLIAPEPRLRTPIGASQSLGTSTFPSPDGSRVALVPAARELSRRFRINDGAGRLVKESETVLPPGHCDHLAFSRDGRTVAFAWHDAQAHFSLFVWDAVAGRELLHLELPAGSIARVALAPDGGRVAVAIVTKSGWSDSYITVWETASGRELFSRAGERTEGTFWPAFSPDGRFIAINPGSAALGDSRFVFLDAQTGKEVATLKGSVGSLTNPTFSRDGLYLAATRAIGETITVLAWEVAPILKGKGKDEPPEPILALTGHGGEVDRVEFSPDGRRMLTSGGGIVKLWDAASGREVLSLKAKGPMLWQAFFSPDGQTIWGGLDEQGRLWGWHGRPVGEGKKP